MYYVYVLKSLKHDFIYVGFTKEVDLRIEQHNSGTNQSTKHYAPFELLIYVAVQTESKAIELEKYFKTGSGRAVLNKHFL